MLNSISLVGRLTADPELRKTQSGISVARFSVAVDRRPVNGESKTDFIPVVAWRETAEFVEKYFRKGSLISIVGELHQESYTDKDGNKRNRFEVVASTIRFCGGKKDNESETKTQREDVKIADEDGFPF